MKKWAGFAGLGLVMAGTNVIAGEPAFDCTKAHGEVEKMICRDSGLAALDQKMQKVFDQAMLAYPETEKPLQRAMQRGWIKGRNECWKDVDVRACTEYEYKTRIIDLQITSGQLEVPPAVALDCNDNSQPFTAVFYEQTDPKSAVLTRGNDQIIVLAKPTASGTKYVGRNVTYNEHQGEIKINWFDNKLECKAKR